MHYVLNQKAYVFVVCSLVLILILPHFHVSFTIRLSFRRAWSKAAPDTFHRTGENRLEVKPRSMDGTRKMNVNLLVTGLSRFE